MKTQEKKGMTRNEFVRRLHSIFMEKTGCHIQNNGRRPCNSCFHSMDADFTHICWLIILGLSEDYAMDESEMLNILEGITAELYKTKSKAINKVYRRRC